MGIIEVQLGLLLILNADDVAQAVLTPQRVLKPVPYDGSLHEYSDWAARVDKARADVLIAARDQIAARRTALGLNFSGR